MTTGRKTMKIDKNFIHLDNALELREFLDTQPAGIEQNFACCQKMPTARRCE